MSPVRKTGRGICCYLSIRMVTMREREIIGGLPYYKGVYEIDGEELGRFADDRILTDVQGGLGVIGDVLISD